MSVIKTQRPQKIQEAWEAVHDSCNYRWVILRGGRGSSKSWGIAEMIILLMVNGYERVLCARYQKNKTDSSVHQIFKDTIKRFGLTPFFTITNTYIRYEATGSEVNYIGLAVNPDEIKSYEGYTIGWVEEARIVPKKTLFDIYPPTVRAGRGLIFASYNPEQKDDPIHEQIETGKISNAKVIDINYWDNPFFPEVLGRDMLHCKKNDDETYQWLWAGGLRKFSDEQIFRDSFTVMDIADFPEIPKERYFGADWSNGGQDPHTLSSCFIKDDTLYIDQAQYLRCDIDELPDRFAEFDDSAENKIFGDCANDGVGKYLRKRGYRVYSLAKLEVEAGIRYLRSFKTVVIASHLKDCITEFNRYSRKTDPKTDEILPDRVDKFHHIIDGVRYSLRKQIAKGL